MLMHGKVSLGQTRCPPLISHLNGLHPRQPVRSTRYVARASNQGAEALEIAAVEAQPSRRHALLGGAALVGVVLTQIQPLIVPGEARADDFITTPSGLKILDLRPGEGASPQPGDTVAVHWSGYTKGYQGKRIDNTSVRDEPYEFVVGSHQAIPAFEEAVLAMKVGGIRRIEVPGEVPGLSYPRNREERFTNELVPNKEGKFFKYKYGPQPIELGGQRALDFVLDNTTLNDLNRTLLFDIKLLAVRKPRSS